MESTKIIEMLRERAMVGRMEVRDKQLMIMAADALERQGELFLQEAKEWRFFDERGCELVGIATLEKIVRGEQK